MEKGTHTIDLSPDEFALAEAVEFDPRATLGNSAAFKANGDLVVRLANGLLERNAIPDQRLRYFTDPAYNAGGRGRSRRDSFIKNGHDSESMMRHGHFLEYLRYFIHGADLPAPVLRTFTQTVEDCGSITSGDIEPLSSTARRLTRAHCLNAKKVADEFYKLSLDLGLSPDDAASIQSSVQQVRGVS